MKLGDIVKVITGCKDCGEVEVRILDITNGKVFVEVIEELPHNAKERAVWVDDNKLKLKECS